MNQLIQDKVTEFVNNTKVFTSLDIANAIKTDGTWVRNRQVASCLRNWTPPVGYGVTKITVEIAGGNTAQASVYVPNTSTVSDYVNTSQNAMTPSEFETMHGKKPFGDNVINPATAAATDATDTDDADTLTAALKSAFNFADPS